MDPSTTLLTSIPKLEDLYYIRCIFSNIQMTHEILKQVYHCQIVFCRDIIKHFPKALASPLPSTEHYIYVIVSKKYYETQKLQEFLKMKKIHYTDPQAVTFEIYKTCAKYSIIYKLLPVWNRVGNYLCIGQKSKELTEELEAIKFDVDINKEGMFLKFNPLKIKVFPLSLEAIDVAKSTIEKYQNTPNIAINFPRQKGYILPSLKRCKLLKITKEIPNICQFESYDVIRDHWKHMFGIVMPKSPDGINYYQVSFRGFEYRTFVYPEICLHAEVPKIIECNYLSEISNRFLEDLKVKVPQICGKELCFNYHSTESSTNFVKPKEMRRGVNDTPSKSSIVKNPCFSGSSSNLNVFNYDPKAVRNFSFQMNFDSPTKSFDSSSMSFSFKSNTSSKLEFVNNWLSNSCNSPASSTETESQQSRDEFEKPRDSPLKKRMRLSAFKKPTIRSIESVKISLSPLKKKKH